MKKGGNDPAGMRAMDHKTRPGQYCEPNPRQARRCRFPINNHQSTITNSCGFTLIELLVVIAIMALLMAILLPVLGRVREQARAVACRSNVKQWGTILALYLEDNEGRFPRTDDGHYDGLSLLRRLYVGTESDPSARGRSQSAGTEGIACCPVATSAGTQVFTSTGSNVWLEVTLGSTFAAWEVSNPSPPFRGSYGLNRNVFNIYFDGLEAPNKRRPVYTDVFAVRHRGNIPLLLDSTVPSGAMIIEGMPPPRTERSEDRLGTGACINRHNGTINGLFLDGSVRQIGLKEIWTLRWHLKFNTAGAWTKAGGVQPEDWPAWMRKFKDY
jgi:prepilin-type N-terminal cleavage/methylation domain-containing protein/prepilin-type processing-associated H-X9-DG protein